MDPRGSRRSRRTGVAARLLALVLLPLIAFGALAVNRVLQYRDSSSLASRIERDVKVTRDSVQLFRVLVNEVIAVGLEKAAVEAHVPVATIAEALGYGPDVRIAEARKATDAAVASFGAASSVSAAQIAALRHRADTVGATVGTTAYVELYDRITAVTVRQLSDLAQRAVQVRGGGPLASALGKLQASIAALQYRSAQTADLSQILVNAPRPQPAALVHLGADTFRYESAAAVLAAASDPVISGPWKQATTRADVRTFDTTIAKVQQAKPVPSGSLASLPVFKGAAASGAALFDIVAATSALVVQRSGALHSSAESVYRHWLIAISVLTVLLIAFALGLARSIIRPLRKLATSARSVGAGNLSVDLGSLGGPRETAVVGKAFDDLVANLRLLEGKSRALASGDFLDPVLAQPLPGRLGEAIASSVKVLSGSIEERDALQQRLTHQAFHDVLTGLANRALFLNRVDHALRRSEREATSVGVLFLDLDEFKTVNDSLGHAAGDELLVAVAARLTSAARASDTVARFGGDEFAVLVEPGEMPQTAEDVAERIAEVLKPSFRLGDTDVVMSASIGVAIGASVDTPADLLRDADMAMYLAKRNGKNRFEIFRPGLQDTALKRLAVTADLRHALENNELEVYYQPIVTAHAARPTGTEALVRWNHPRRGLVLPLEFIDVAETTGLIVPLGVWILNEACRQAQAWREAGIVDDDFYIAVNLSARQLAEPALVDTVARALHDSGLPASALVLEITESTLMINFATGLARLWSLKELGLRLALDDYGTGYSSLNRLGKLPIDIVKIDKTFVDQITVRPQGAAVIKSVIDVAAALGLTSLAEGVEEPDQLAALDELGCDNIQGYLFARPMPAAAAASILQRLRAVEKVADTGSWREVDSARAPLGSGARPS